MILVDTSIWIEHLRSHLQNRQTLLGLLNGLPHVSVATDHEVLRTIENRQRMGRGIGFIEAHLLTSAMLSLTTIWTADRRLGAVARELGLVRPAEAR